MRLPNGHLAVITDEKLLGYLLNPDHPANPGHAELFGSLLGIDQKNAVQLREALLTAEREGEVSSERATAFGRKFRIYFDMTGARGSYTILSAGSLTEGRTCRAG